MTIYICNLVFNYLSSINRAKKTQFMDLTEDVLEFLDLKFTFDHEYKHMPVDTFAKATNGFTHVPLRT